MKIIHCILGLHPGSPYEDNLLKTQLLTNRAAAQFHLGNFDDSLTDCQSALSLKEDHFKAIKRGALCLFKLRKYKDCVVWAHKALEIDDKDAEVKETLQNAMKHEIPMD